MERAVFCSTNAWRSPAHVGSHHFADYLVRRGWQVLWLCAPLGPLHLLGARRPEVRVKLETLRAPGTPPLEDRAPLTLAPMGGPLGFRSAWTVRTWHRLSVPRVVRLLERWRHAELLFVDSPLYAFAPRVVEADTTVYRITDFTPGFGGASRALLEAEARAVREADATVVTTASLAGYAESLGATRTVVVPNGVDVARFSEPRPASPLLEGIPRPRAVYVGSLREWFDHELVNRLAQRRPDLSVVLVGPPDTVASRVVRADNLHVVGAVPYDEVPAILQSCEVGLIPFDVRRHRALLDQVDPLKLHEYMAAGLPVVASRWERLEQLRSPALLVDGIDDFVAAVDEALLHREDLARSGREFASASDWTRRFDGLMATMGMPPRAPRQAEEHGG